MILLLFLLLLVPSVAYAQSGPGLWQAAPNTQIGQCTSIGTPVENRTWCFDGNNKPNYTIKVWDGSQYITILGGGGGGGLAGTGNFPFLARWKDGVTNTLENSIVADTGVEFAVPEILGVYNKPLRFYDATGTNWVGLQGPAIMTNHYTCRWPGSSGVTGQVLTTDGAGDTCNLTWTTPSILGFGMSGKLQFCDTTTTGTVTFVNPAPDANYAVVLGTQKTTGSPPHVLADYNTPTLNGFGISISDQPGVGNCVQVSWATGPGPAGGSSGGSGTVTSVTATPPITVTPNPIVNTGTVGCPTCVTGTTLTGGQLIVGAGGQNVTIGNLTGDVTTSATTVTTLSDLQKMRVCTMWIGADNGPVLVDADLGPQFNVCSMPTGGTILEVRVSADAGTPSVMPQMRSVAGVPGNILSAPLVTGTAGANACANAGGTLGFGGPTCSATLTTTTVATGTWLGLTSGTAGGVAKRMTVVITYKVP